MMERIEHLENDLTVHGVIVDDKLLGPGDPDGLYLAAHGKPSLVLVNRRLHGPRKLCVLAEEAGHHYRSAGLALDDHDVTQRKNELAGRDWAYAELVPLEKLVRSWQRGNTTVYDLADDLDVTEEFLRATIEYHHRKHGVLATWGRWVIQFDPHFDIYRER